MLIFDAHLDMAWNALEFNRDLTLPVAGIREFEQNFKGIVSGRARLLLEDCLRKGRVGMTICTFTASAVEPQRSYPFINRRGATRRRPRAILRIGR